MALVLKDRVKQLTETDSSGGGNSTIDLQSASVTGFQTFTTALADGDTFYYSIVDNNAGTWETGLGTWDETNRRITRTTVYDNSNNDTSAVNFANGAKDVFITQPASKAVFEDASNNVAISGNITVDKGSSGLPAINLSHSNANADNFQITGGTPGVANSGFTIRDVDASANRLIIDTSGNTTLGGSITVTGGNSGNWNTAYGWGDHGSAGYLTSLGTALVDADFGSAGLMATNGSGTYSIVSDSSSNWNTAYGWGDHASGGYLTTSSASSTYMPKTGGTFTGDWGMFGNNYHIFWDKANSQLNFGDNARANFGSNFVIYCNATNGFIVNNHGDLNIETGTGDIWITNGNNDADVTIQTDDGSGGNANYIKADGSTGEVLLNHYGNTKLTTKSTGVDITGYLSLSGNTSPIAPITIGTGGASAGETISIFTNYTSDSAQKGHITWRDASNITGQIDTRYNGNYVAMHFGSLYSNGYSTQSRFAIRGNGAIEFSGSTGQSGQVLTSDGSSSEPTWQTPSSGGISAGKSIVLGMAFG